MTLGKTMLLTDKLFRGKTRTIRAKISLVQKCVWEGWGLVRFCFVGGGGGEGGSNAKNLRHTFMPLLKR